MRHYNNKALRSFFGARTGGQDRPQSINTPQFLIDAILYMWPRIELDPCTNVWSKVPAEHKVVAKELLDQVYFVSSQKYPITKNGGLGIDWPEYTYANVPYRDLKLWLVKPVPTMEHLILCPVRTHRKWFCEAIGQASICCFLKPFAFDGHKQCYPTPLVMAYWGCRLDKFIEAFASYGMIGTLRAIEYVLQPLEQSLTESQLTLQL